ncbi:DUF4124 domain-containing protein [Neisseria yangbaofengii]|uniref:DUF4124 domain-containing protein n=1 Tax=Neisseria yangbaofengii TaxID=2709396 RepID=UPI0013ECF30E|nr:DUF4124 domain-containing protein [Neisseria yangbaofengii]
MKTTLTYTLLTLCLSFTAATASTNSVYTWRNTNGTATYSDVPHRLQPARSNTMNVRTHTVYQPAKAAAPAPNEGSIAEQDQLNQRITEANKQIEAQNQKIAENNQAMKDDNCKAARLNRDYAESARANNREALKQRYDADISKYCN